MSDIETLDREFGNSKKPEVQRMLKVLKNEAKIKARLLKRQRNRIDKQARLAFKAYRDNGDSWKGKQKELNRFRSLMDKRHKLHERINRIVGEKVEPEWDSES